MKTPHFPLSQKLVTGRSIEFIKGREKVCLTLHKLGIFIKCREIIV